MDESLADHFILQMQRQLDKREEEGVKAVTVDMRDHGLDFYATLACGVPLKFFCRGTSYDKSPEGDYTMEAGDGTTLAIDEFEYFDRLDYALSCIGASTESGISVLVKRHIKEL